jgi:aminoglycoside phosphotransferase family enzyme
MLREQEAVDQASEAQRSLVQALRDPACYPHRVGSISIIETHISFIVLTGTFASKIKKSVDLGFPQDALADRVLARDELTSRHMNALAALVAEFHTRSHRCTPKFRQGHRFFQSRARTSHIASQVHPC